MQHFCSFVSQACHWCPPFSAGHVAFLLICLPHLSLLVSALFGWPCSISIHLSPRSVTGVVRPFPLAMQHFYSFVSQVCHCWCAPFSAGDVRLSPRSVTGGVRPFPLFLFICLPCLSLLMSALFRWPCSISIRLSPRLVTGGVRPFPLFLFICLPDLSLVSALFRWPSTWRYSFVSQVCHCQCPPFLFISHAGVRPCPLAMQHFCSCVSQACHCGVRSFPLAM